MESDFSAGPLTGVQLIDEYFIENRTRLLDLAAFLDRLDRAADPDIETDFRRGAFREALRTLSDSNGARVGANSDDLQRSDDRADRQPRPKIGLRRLPTGEHRRGA
ncbi:MAG: hypothetical protein MPW15_20045 [Candidatus Manganitrophus sp.]|nr:hypothetical protein [Candidatus Manganitrophus sp.]